MRVRITDISPADMFYDVRERYIGKIAEVADSEIKPLYPWANGWTHGYLVLGNEPLCFYEFKYEVMS